MQNKLLTALCLTLLWIAAAAPFADAAKLDAYRQMIQARSCTVRFENITPPERAHNKDKRQISYDWDSKEMLTAPQYVNRSYEGILVLHGADLYEERNYGDYSKCRLTKADKVYQFARQKVKKDKEKYYSASGEGQVSAYAADEESRLVYGETFGDGDVTRLLQILLPADKKPLGTPRYTFVGQGSLPDGQSYEDYRTEDGGVLEAVRFYFKGESLVRIASMSYWQQDDGIVKGRKCILKINEFSSVPDEKLLTLPSELKDITK